MIYIYMEYMWDRGYGGNFQREKNGKNPWVVLRGEAGGFLLWWPPRPVAAGAPYAMISPPDPLFQMLQEGLDRRVSDILAAIVFIESRSSGETCSGFFPILGKFFLRSWCVTPFPFDSFWHQGNFPLPIHLYGKSEGACVQWAQHQLATELAPSAGRVIPTCPIKTFGERKTKYT